MTRGTCKFMIFPLVFHGIIIFPESKFLLWKIKMQLIPDGGGAECARSFHYKNLIFGKTNFTMKN